MNSEPSNEQPVEANHPGEVPPVETVEPIQAAPAETSQTILPPSLEVKEKKPKNFWQKSLPWAAVVLGCLLVGFALGFILLYMPTESSLQTTQSELASANSQLALVNTKTDGLQSKLDSAASALETAQKELDATRFSLAISRLQENISYTRLALVNKDTLTARQELMSADANLADLTLLLKEPDTTSALADRLKNIRANLSSDPSKALEELRLLGENLARLESR